jgi:hypothetical protein
MRMIITCVYDALSKSVRVVAFVYAMLWLWLWILMLSSERWVPASGRAVDWLIEPLLDSG